MEILYLLIPVSVVLVLAIVGLFGWALNSGQMDDLEREGERIFEHEEGGIDRDQDVRSSGPAESPAVNKD
jgi:cbb3-type cytochrome oxidase maturation protein